MDKELLIPWESIDSMPDPIEEAREFVRGAFANLGSRGELEETALIRNGQYCGHQFHAGGLNAVWFFEESEVKIFGPHRKLLLVESLDQPVIAHEQRRAA